MESDAGPAEHDTDLAGGILSAVSQCNRGTDDGRVSERRNDRSTRPQWCGPKSLSLGCIRRRGTRERSEIDADWKRRWLLQRGWRSSQPGSVRKGKPQAQCG